MNAHLLIDAVVQQTMVFIAQLATAGGVRTPVAQLANQVFLDLSEELQSQGVSKKVIADMFGMALRTYHRKVRSCRQSQSEEGSTVWEAVFRHICRHEPIAATAVYQRFGQDDLDVVTGVLNDLVSSGLVYRAGRGDRAMYRMAAAADFATEDQDSLRALDWLVWLTVYRAGPLTRAQVEQQTRATSEQCREALERLLAQGHIDREGEGDDQTYTSGRFEVPLGQSHGWEAAVLDHFQALVTAVAIKLGDGAASARLGDLVGGSTWTLDVGKGHPLREEAVSTLARLRREVEELRERIDAYNAGESAAEPAERVVVYVGQYVREV
ncbi:MAG TPA: crosslink repair DNA glycosylase YcaQ family protein [Polyangiaceae bacterium]